MIASKLVAKQISDLMLEVGDRLDASVELVQQNCSPDELATYRRAVGSIMGEILILVLNPLYGKHPTLKPTELE